MTLGLQRLFNCLLNGTMTSLARDSSRFEKLVYDENFDLNDSLVCAGRISTFHLGIFGLLCSLHSLTLVVLQMRDELPSVVIDLTTVDDLFCSRFLWSEILLNKQPLRFLCKIRVLK